MKRSLTFQIWWTFTLFIIVFSIFFSISGYIISVYYMTKYPNEYLSVGSITGNEAENSIPYDEELATDEFEVFIPISFLDERGNLDLTPKKLLDGFVDLLSFILFDFTSIFVFLIAVILIPALIISRSLGRPIRELQKSAERIANRDFSGVINIKRKDEIGKLARSLENMRTQLLAQNTKQQRLLQAVSHELKTPVMIIRSYIQALKDGLYPQGSFENTLEILDSESMRIEKKVQNLLYLTKLDYLSQFEEQKRIDFFLDEKILEVKNKMFSTQNENIWDINLEHISIQGDPEQWSVVIENLLDNQFRYCKTKVFISLRKKDVSILLTFSNDGPTIREDFLETMFKEFHIGEKGKFGLGLTIVKEIVQSHGGSVSAGNENGRLVFSIKLAVAE